MRCGTPPSEAGDTLVPAVHLVGVEAMIGAMDREPDCLKPWLMRVAINEAKGLTRRG